MEANSFLKGTKTIVLMAVFMVAFGLLMAQTAVRPSGAGTSASPYLISTLAHLAWMSGNTGNNVYVTPEWWVNANTLVHFRQTANIDASATTTWNGGAGFRPIGYMTTIDGMNNRHFVGVYDGRGYSINELYINRTSFIGIGLFGSITGVNATTKAVVKNLKLSVILDSGGLDDQWVGALAGQARWADIENCYTNGTIIATSNETGGAFRRIKVGGIVGETFQNTRIMNSSARGARIGRMNRSGTSYAFVGGLVGYMSDSSIVQDSYALGQVSVSIPSGSHYGRFAGGIAGEMQNSSQITRCYTNANISISAPGSQSAPTGGYYCIGGIAGATHTNWNGSMTYNNWLKGPANAVQGRTPANNWGANSLSSMQNSQGYAQIGMNFRTIWNRDTRNEINEGLPFHRWAETDDAPKTFSINNSPAEQTSFTDAYPVLRWTYPFFISSTASGGFPAQTAITGYRIYRRAGTSGNFTAIHTTANATTYSYTDQTADGITYQYYVVGVYANPTGETLPTNTLTYTRTYVQVNATSTITNISDVSINWSGTGLFTGYRLERKTGLNGTWTQLMQMNTAPSGSYVDRAVMRNTVYYYRISTLYTNPTGAGQKIVGPVVVTDEAIDPFIVGSSISSSYTWYQIVWDRRKSVSQTIYTAQEMAQNDQSQVPRPGTIYQITFKMKGGNNPPIGANTKYYLANTAVSQFANNNSWIPMEQFTLVYDGVLNYSSIQNNATGDIVLTLDSPFQYSGGNLALMAVKDDDVKYGSGNNYHSTNVPGQNRNIYWWTDTANSQLLAGGTTVRQQSITNAYFYIWPELYGSVGDPNSTEFSNQFTTYNFQDSINQIIYHQNEVGTGAGTLYQMNITMRRNSPYPPNNVPVKIYLTNVPPARASFANTNDWQPFADFVQVYNGPLDMGPNTPDTRVVPIRFDTPFDYTGENLIVMVVKDHNTTYGTQSVQLTRATENRLLYWRSNNAGSPSTNPYPTATYVTNELTNAEFFVWSAAYVPPTYVGNPSSTATSTAYPYDFSYSSFVSQTIYYDSEISRGIITNLTWRLSGANDVPADEPVKIYIAPTSKTAFTSNTDWQGYGESSWANVGFVQVFSGPLRTGGGAGNGNREVSVNLTNPYIHTGGNIIVMVTRPLRTNPVNNTTTWRVTTGGTPNRTLYQRSMLNNMDIPTNLASDGRVTGYPNLMFRSIAISDIKPPRELTATQVSGAVYLTWFAPDVEPSEPFQVFEYIVSRNGWGSSMSIPATQVGIIDPNPAEGPYQYQVVARYMSPNAQGGVGQVTQSPPAYCDIVVVNPNGDTMPDELPPPTHVRGTLTEGGVLIEWEKPVSGFPDNYLIVWNNVIQDVQLTPFARSYLMTDVSPGVHSFMVAAFYEFTYATSTDYSYSVDMQYTPQVISYGTDWGVCVTNQWSSSIGVEYAGVSVEAGYAFGIEFSVGGSVDITPAFWSESYGESWSEGIEFSYGPFYKYSIPASITVPPAPPAAPINLRAMTSHDYGQSWGSVSLEWTAPQTPIPTSYQVYRDGFPVSDGLITTGTTYTDNNSFTGFPIAGNLYKYYVTAIYGTGDNAVESNPSNTIQAIPVAGVRPWNWDVVQNSADPGTYFNPYEIETFENLLWLSAWNRDRASSATTPATAGDGWWQSGTTLVYFKQTADIDASITQNPNWNHGRGLRPIGRNLSPTDNRFVGVYDGQGFKITGLYIDAETSGLTPTGLFSSIQSSTIKNVHLENAIIRGSIIAGGIVGEMSAGSVVENCSFSGFVSAFGSAGGLVGASIGLSEIKTSQSNGIVYAHVGGGIAGTLNASAVRNCFTSTTIYSGYGGAIAGNLISATITNSYSIGEIIDEGYGGYYGEIAGYALTDNYNYDNGTPISDIFWLTGETDDDPDNGIYRRYVNTNQSRSGRNSTRNDAPFGKLGGIPASNTAGKTLAEMKTVETFAEAGWDFDGVWAIDPAVNFGFPHLINHPHSNIILRIPSNLTGVSQNFAVNLTWDAPETGSSGTFVSYRVYRDGILIGTTTDEAYSDSSWLDGIFTYTVRAVYRVNEVLYESEASNAVPVEAVAAPIDLSASVSTDRVVLSWFINEDSRMYREAMGHTASSLRDNNATLSRARNDRSKALGNLSDDSPKEEHITLRNTRALLGFNVYRDGDPIPLNETLISVDEMIFVDSLVTLDTRYVYVVTAEFDDAPSFSSNVAAVILPIFNPPTQLAEVHTTHESVTLIWHRPATQNYGTIANYSLFVDGIMINTTITDTTFTHTELTPGQTYSYYVKAHYVDPNGDSAPSNTITITTTVVVGNEDDVDMPLVTGLRANYPNPFNPSTTIQFTIGNAPTTTTEWGGVRGGASSVQIDIYNIKGQKVRSLVNSDYPAGTHKVVWNGTDDNGRNVSSGVYFYRMKTEGFVQTRKMLLMK